MANEFDLSDPFAMSNPRRSGLHSSPYDLHSQLYTPRRLKELFKWCEFLFYNSPQIYAALRKFGEYPITDFTYETSNSSLKKKYKNLLETTLRARELLVEMTMDKYVYGNAFISMYQPFLRYLKCPKCNSLTNIKNLSYEYSYDKLQFRYTCPNCKKSVVAGEKEVEDRKLAISRGINFIRWDPKLMDIDHNPITAQSIYYYTIPPELTTRVQHGHRSLIDTLPLSFLKTIKEKKHFKFAPQAIRHLKVGGPAGVSPQWGLPPTLPALPMFHFVAALRKANEAIALDYMVPLRVVHPGRGASPMDPVTSISLENWKDNMKASFGEWRKDPLHIMFAPIPVETAQIGGQGRALLTLGEVQEAEKGMISSLGVPIEFIYGGLTGKGMEATLRLIENQLQTHIADLKDLLQWVADSCAKFLGWPKIKTGMTPFRITDDYMQKQIIMQMYMQGIQTGDQTISDTTITELNNIDLDKERERIKQEALDKVRAQQELELEIKKIQNNMAQQIQMAAQEGTVSYDQQQIIGQADQIVAQLMTLDAGMRKSHLDALQVEDYILYSVVIQRMEQQEQTLQGQGGY